MERELVDLAKRGDEEAFDALARQVGDRCMAIASWILRDADLAEDAVQATLVRAWRDLPTLRDADRFEPWLHRILTNECYAEARRRRRWSANIRLLPTEQTVAEDSVLTVHDRDQLDRAFRRLTLEQRGVRIAAPGGDWTRRSGRPAHCESASVHGPSTKRPLTGRP